MPTSTVEDYLKRIFLAEQSSPGARVLTGRIAGDLGVTPGTATTMIKTLADSGLVEHEPYAGVRLTAQGRVVQSGPTFLRPTGFVPPGGSSRATGKPRPTV